MRATMQGQLTKLLIRKSKKSKSRAYDALQELIFSWEEVRQAEKIADLKFSKYVYHALFIAQSEYMDLRADLVTSNHVVSLAILSSVARLRRLVSSAAISELNAKLADTQKSEEDIKQQIPVSRQLLQGQIDKRSVEASDLNNTRKWIIGWIVAIVTVSLCEFYYWLNNRESSVANASTVFWPIFLSTLCIIGWRDSSRRLKKIRLADKLELNDMELLEISTKEKLKIIAAKKTSIEAAIRLLTHEHGK